MHLLGTQAKILAILGLMTPGFLHMIRIHMIPRLVIRLALVVILVAEASNTLTM